ncbi:MAG: penicillin-binding protein 2 [Holosporaceae bacterium]|jgi:cell division protein FtsI (penicillin-binding protein 3)|nr:penicillin-binding protein 2 [Holosporaceae bacterium]
MYKGYGNNLYALSSRAIKTAKRRVLFGISVFLVLFFVIIIRLVHVMIFSINDFNHATEFSGDNTSPVVVARADILDRNGVIVATSLPTVSAYACPHELIDAKEAAKKLTSVFSEMDLGKLSKKLSLSKKFLWIKRNLSPQQEQAVLNLGIPGIHFLRTERRVYPDKNLMAHIVGGTDIDNIGISGIEKIFDGVLRESSSPVTLSVDTKIQYAVRDELQKGLEEFRAIGGAAIVLEITTGEIIAMVSLPDFDPNKNADPNAMERFNLVTSSAIEPGSSAKILNTAFALESRKITPFTKFDATKPLKLGKFIVHDFRGRCMFLTVEEILKYSSNIGSAKIATELGPVAQRKFLKHIGLLDTVSCELPEVQHPIYPKKWSDISAATISYGHGIAISPLHLITIFSSIVNDGIVHTPTLVKRDLPIPGRRVISSTTSKQMRALMRLNVTEGTNKFADVPGYCVGGKSGTAEKQKRGRYLKDANYTGFYGAFPMTAPRYAVYVVLNEPKTTPKTHGYRTAGWNAAPLAANIIGRIGPMLGVTTTNTNEPNWHYVLEQATKTREHS